jgi:hypothetical protein
VIERVVRRAEEFLEGLAVVERRVVLAGMKRTILTFSSDTMLRNSVRRLRRSRGSSVVCVRSPVKITKSGTRSSALTDAMAFGNVPWASGLGAPSKPQWLSDSWTK